MSERRFRRKLERRAGELLRDIDQYFRECRSRGERGYPGYPIPPDPDGRLGRLRATLAAPRTREGSPCSGP